MIRFHVQKSTQPIVHPSSSDLGVLQSSEFDCEFPGMQWCSCRRPTAELSIGPATAAGCNGQGSPVTLRLLGATLRMQAIAGSLAIIHDAKAGEVRIPWALVYLGGT